MRQDSSPNHQPDSPRADFLSWVADGHLNTILLDCPPFSETIDQQGHQTSDVVSGLIREMERLKLRVTRLEQLLMLLYHNVQNSLFSPVAPGQRIMGDEEMMNVELPRAALDRVCIPILERTPDPTAIDINSILRILDESFPQHDRRAMLSMVRKWFRKRREELGLRVIGAFRKNYSTEMGSVNGRRRLLQEVLQEYEEWNNNDNKNSISEISNSNSNATVTNSTNNNNSIDSQLAPPSSSPPPHQRGILVGGGGLTRMTTILQDAQLPFIDEGVARRFACFKMKTFLEKHPGP